jgi:hypothetical protein
MADGVAEVVTKDVGAISRQSVYDSLRVLVGEGLIRRRQPAGSPPASKRVSATTVTTWFARFVDEQPTSTVASARRRA